MTDIKCIDSSVWLSYYEGQSHQAKEIIDHESLLLTPSLCLFEVTKKLLKSGRNPEELIRFIHTRSKIISINAHIAQKAATISIQNKLGAADALIYTVAQIHRAELISADNDFRGLPNTIILP